MTRAQLECPTSVEELYLARGDDVPQYRPLATGDVLRAPQYDDEPGDGRLIIVTHPCSMRSDGVTLRDKLLVAPVRRDRELALGEWKGFYSIMPLPDLDDEGGHFAAQFHDMQPVPSTTLDSESRVACLSTRGVNFLMQRFVMHLTRVVVETHRFDAACRGPFDELEIVEDWCEEAAEAGIDPHNAAHACHEWLREAPGGGVTRQARLGDAQLSPQVRRDSDVALSEWIREHDGA